MSRSAIRHLPRALTLLVAAAALSPVSSAVAATYQWDTNGATAGLGGTGTWDTTNTFWDLYGTAPDDGTATTTAYTFTNLDTAIFGGTAGTVTLGTGVIVNGLTFNTAGYTVTGNTLTLDGTTPTIATNFGTTTISSILAGTTAWTKSGTGTLSLSGTNSGLSGNITISSGTLLSTNTAGLGTGTVTLGDTNSGANSIALLWTPSATTQTVANAIIVSANGTGLVTIGTTANTQQNQTFSGALTLNRATTLQAGTTDRLNFSGVISGNVGTLTIASADSTSRRIVFNAATANTYTGDLVINANTILQLGVGSAAKDYLYDSGAVTANGTLYLSYTGGNETIGALNGSGSVGNNGGSGTLTIGNGGGSGTFTGVISGGTNIGIIKTGAGTQTLTGTNTYTGVTTISAGTLVIGGAGSLNSGSYAGALTVNGTLRYASSVAQTLSGVLTGTGGLIKEIGTGTLTLSGNTAGGLGAGVTVTAGTLLLDNSNLATPTNMLAATNTLTLGGGTLNVKGKTGAVATAQTFAGTTLNSGASTLTTQLNTGTSNTINLGAITRNIGATLNITATNALTSTASTTEIVKTTGLTYNGTAVTLPGTGTKYVGAGIFTNSGANTRYAQIDSAGQFIQGPTPTAWVTTGGDANIVYSTTAGSTQTGGLTMYAGIFNATGATTQALGANNLTTNGILNINTGTTTISGTGKVVIGAENDLVIHTASTGGITISSVIQNGTGAGALTFTAQSTGSLVLSGANTYTGVTTINSGTLQVGNNSALGTTAAGTTVNAGGTLDLNAKNIGAETVTLAGGTLTNTAGSDAYITSVTAGAGTSGIINAASGWIQLNGTTGSGSLTFSSTNAKGTYTQGTIVYAHTGGTTLSSGGLDLYGGATVTGGPITVKGGTLKTLGSNQIGDTLAVTVNGGAWQLSGVDTIGSLGGTGGTVSLGGNALTTGDSSNTTFAGVITGTGGSLVKQGTGTMTLTGANTYTGTTTISAGTLQIGGSNALNAGAYAGNITNNATLQYSSSANQTLSGNISGTGAIIKDTGVGTLTLSGSNSYSGPTTISAGRLNLTGATNASSFTLNTGATLGGTGSTTGGLTTITGATLALNGFTAASGLSFGGAVNFAGATALVFDTTPTSVTGVNSHTVVSYGSLSNGIANLTGPTGFRSSSITDDTVNKKVLFSYTAADRTWNRATAGNWDSLTTTSWAEGDQLFASGDAVTFNDTATSGAVTLAGTLNPRSVTFNNSTLNYTLTGSGVIAGTTGLVKTGTGTVTLSNTASNTYTGSTDVQQGTLIANYNAGTAVTAIGAGSTINVASNATFKAVANDANITLANVLTGSGTVIIDPHLTAGGGVRDVLLSANNSGFTGTLKFSSTTGVASGSGTWRAGGSLATSYGSGNIIVENGAQIQLGAFTYANNFTLTGMGYAETAGGTPMAGSGLTQYSGATKGGIGAIRGGAGSVISGSVTLNGTAKVMAYGDTLTISGNITNTNSTDILVAGGGGSSSTLILTGDNSGLEKIWVNAGSGTTSGTDLLQIGATNGGATGTLGSDDVILHADSAKIAALRIWRNNGYTLAAGQDILADVTTSAHYANTQVHVNTTGTGLTLNGNTVDLSDGTNGGTLSVGGANGGTSQIGAILNIQGASIVEAGNLWLGESTASSGIVNQSGGTVSVINTLRVSHYNNNTNASEYNLSGGTLTLSGAVASTPSAAGEQSGGIYVGVDGWGKFTQSGSSTINTKFIVVDNRSANTGIDELNLNGGTLNLQSQWGIIARNAGSSTVTLNGGTIVNNASAGTAVIIDTPVTVGTSGGILDTSANATSSLVLTGDWTNNSVAVTGSGKIQFNPNSKTTRDGTSDGLGNQILSTAFTGGASATFEKIGAGTTTLSGANSYSGNTLVTAGTLVLANSLALQNSVLDTTGSIAGSASAGLKSAVTTLTLGGLSGNKDLASLFTTTSGGYNTVTALTLNPGSGVTAAYSGVVADGAAGMTLTKSGAGTLTLSGANTYTGQTTVSAGSLVVSGSLASGNALTVGASGTADFQNAGQTLGAVSNANTATNALNFSAASGTVTLASLTGDGNTRFGSNATVTGGIGSGTVTTVGALNANISGTAAVTAGGQLTGALSGGTVGAGSLSSSSVTGGTHAITGAASITTIDGGATTVGGVATIGTMTSGTANLNGATSAITALNGGTVNLGTTTALTVNEGTFSGSISGGSLTKNGTGNLTLGSANTFNGLTVNAGTLTAGHANALGSGTVTVSGGELALGGVNVAKTTITVTGGKVTGAGAYTGTLDFGGSTNVTLDGTYKGTVSLGTSATRGYTATNNFTVASGGTLQGQGTVNGNVTVEGEMRIGNSPGTLNVETGDVTLAAGSSSYFEIGALNSYDYLNVQAGTLTLNGTIYITAYNFDTTTLSVGSSFNFIDGNIAPGFDVANLDFAGATLASGLQWDTSDFASTGELRVVSAIPEPSTYGLLGAGALALATAVRRRRRAAR